MDTATFYDAEHSVGNATIDVVRDVADEVLFSLTDPTARRAFLAYAPGNGTVYNLIFTLAPEVKTAAESNPNGWTITDRAVTEPGLLVALVNFGTAAVFPLQPTEAGYVGEKLDLGPHSPDAKALSNLLNAVIDAIIEAPEDEL